MNIFKVGSYVMYKNKAYIIVKLLSCGNLAIIHPCLDGNGQATNTGKLSVSLSNLKLVQTKNSLQPVVVSHKGNDYIVTMKNNIFSLRTGKLMMWHNGNGDRNAIIGAALTERVGVML